MFSLKGKVGLITGAATGLGQAIAVALAQCGADIAISDKQLDCLFETETLLAALGRKIHKLAMDVRDPEQVKAGLLVLSNSLAESIFLSTTRG